MKNVVVVGAGTGGIMLASQFMKKGQANVMIIDPAEYHYYQPAWTLVGANTYDFEKTRKRMADVIPTGVKWVREFVDKLDPDNNKLTLKGGIEIKYDFLVLSPGVVMDYSQIEGLEAALETDSVCSNYVDPRKTWEVLKNFKGGNALFTQPNTPIKCGGAPQKTAYMSADYLRKTGMKSKTNIIYATPGTVIFGIKPIRETLEKVLVRHDVHFKPYYIPVKIDSINKRVTFKYRKEGAQVEIDQKIEEKDLGDQLVEIPYDMLHIAPPQVAPEFIRASPLTNEAGWVDVDKETLQHVKYKNIFGIGDAAGLPTAKTGAAIRKQVPVVVDSLVRLLNDQSISEKKYDGYSSCPIVTGYGKMVLAEFDYDGNFIPDPQLKKLLIKDSSKEHWRLWMLKKYILPYLYWKKIIKGIDV